MTWQTIDTLDPQNVPEGRQIMALDTEGEMVFAEMEHRPDGQRLWIIAKTPQGRVAAPHDLMFWQERPAPPS